MVQEIIGIREATNRIIAPELLHARTDGHRRIRQHEEKESKLSRKKRQRTGELRREKKIRER